MVFFHAQDFNVCLAPLRNPKSLIILVGALLAGEFRGDSDLKSVSVEI
jgi:hypothetical protein